MLESLIKKIQVYVISLGSITGVEVLDYVEVNDLIKVTGQTVIVILTIIYISIKIKNSLKNRRK